MNSKFIQILTKLKAGKFKQLPRSGRILCSENIEQMQANLWSMFNLKYSKSELEKFHTRRKFPFGANVVDYAWTGDVKEAFYSHPCHVRLVKAMKKDKKSMIWGMWVLQVEPADYEGKKLVFRKTTKSKMNSLMRDVAWSLHPMDHAAVLEKYWDFQEEKPREVPVIEVTEPVMKFMVDYLYMMVKQGETVTLSEMKNESASLIRTVQEELFNVEENLKKI